MGQSDSGRTMLRLYISLFLAGLTTSTTLSQSCCPTKVVAGEDSLAGTYQLYDGPANFLPVCQDQCAYKKEGNTEDTYCFKTEGATHNTVCQEIGWSTEPATTAGSGGSGGGCPYDKINLSWGEYQVKIPMPGGSASYAVVIKFDADTTIQSCHSNCAQNPSCTGDTCTITYTGTDPLWMFNIKKTNPGSESDRSNMVSVTINRVEQC